MFSQKFKQISVFRTNSTELESNEVSEQADEKGKREAFKDYFKSFAQNIGNTAREVKHKA